MAAGGELLPGQVDPPAAADRVPSKERKNEESTDLVRRLRMEKKAR